MKITYIIMRKYCDSYFMDLIEGKPNSVYWTKAYYKAKHFDSVEEAEQITKQVEGDIYEVQHEITLVP